MKKVKFKTKAAFTKRFIVTGSGKVKRAHSYAAHLFDSKSAKRKRHLRKGSYLSTSDYKRSKQMLGLRIG